MVTHDDELAARAPRTVVLADGLIVDEIIRERSQQSPADCHAMEW
jgi:hypothetical protein